MDSFRTGEYGRKEGTVEKTEFEVLVSNSSE
jgi:hypothetical protein